MSYPLGSNPSFVDLLRATAEGRPIPQGRVEVAGGAVHGTTVLALKYDGGVVMAGDRRAVEGFSIADERIEKVFPTDEHSAVAISGAAGQATEVVKLFQTEIEHYEKVEGERLSLEGKANRLAQMIRGNLPLAMQGLVVVPLFGGYDERRRQGRIFRYDVTGGRWEEADFHATGSGGVYARGTLKKRWRRGIDLDVAVMAAVEALVDASQEDVATGGPDAARGLFPSVKAIGADGVHTLSDDEVHTAYDRLVGASAELAHRPVGASGAREAEE